MMSPSDGLSCNKSRNILMIALHLSNDFFLFVAVFLFSGVFFIFSFHNMSELYLEFWLKNTLAHCVLLTKEVDGK